MEGALALVPQVVESMRAGKTPQRAVDEAFQRMMARAGGAHAERSEADAHAAADASLRAWEGAPPPRAAGGPVAANRLN